MCNFAAVILQNDNTMKRKILLAINGFLATILTALGFSSCNGGGGIGRVECMYGGPDMYDSTLRQRTIIDKNGDTLEITGNDTIVKQKVIADQKEPDQMRVMYGTPYSKFSEKERIIVPEESK